MEKVLAALMALTLLGGAVRAEEDDDDPKAKHTAPVPKKPAATAATPVTKPAEAAKPKTAAADPAPAAKKVAVVDETPAKAAAKSDPPAAPVAHKTHGGEPSAKPAPPEPRASLPLPPAAEAGAGRAVRVRLIDGSTVVGQVRAEQAEALVIDCALGQLAIPRARVSTIAYDAAAGVGQKRAPVQQLDDGDLPTKRKSAQP